MSWENKIKSLIKKLEDYVNLSPFTTLDIGGPAEFFVTVGNVEELANTLIRARSIGVPYKVIGHGSNIVVSDKGFHGLIICNKADGLNVDINQGRVIADSGVPLSRMILEAASRGLGGLEPLYGIPGTVGGAIINNAGAHGVSVSQFFKSSSVLASSEKILNCRASWFKFGYRNSKLKFDRSPSPPVILSAIFQFQKRKKDDALSDIAKHKGWREEHQPIGEKTCGSIFRNPLQSDNAKDTNEQAQTAGFLLDKAGAKKFMVGGARVSRKHANWIINQNHSSARDIRNLIDKMREAVEEKFSLTLKEEVEYVGNWEL